MFPRVQAEYLERNGSDHKPLFVRFVNENVSRTGRFVFDKRWSTKPEFLEIIKTGWLKDDGTGANTIMNRIAECRRMISHWKRESNQNSKVRIQQLRRKIDMEGIKLRPNQPLLK